MMSFGTGTVRRGEVPFRPSAGRFKPLSRLSRSLFIFSSSIKPGRNYLSFPSDLQDTIHNATLKASRYSCVSLGYSGSPPSGALAISFLQLSTGMSESMAPRKSTRIRTLASKRAPLALATPITSSPPRKQAKVAIQLGLDEITIGCGRKYFRFTELPMDVIHQV